MTLRLKGRGALAVLLLIQLVALANSVLHDPLVGYDAPEHVRNIESLAKLRLPFDSKEWFCPPLSYAVPALVLRAGWAGPRGAAKCAQAVNVAWSFLLCFLVLALCERDRARRFWSLALLGLMPVYYRSFAFVRPEPLLALLSVACAWQCLRALRGNSLRSWLLLGLLLGLALLCKQWSYFLFPAIAAYVMLRRGSFKGLALSFAASAVVGGWFYALVGGPLAFAKSPHPRASLAYFAGLRLRDLWSDPVWAYKLARPIPVLYSDFWTDAHSYFLVYGRDRTQGAYYSGNDLSDKLEAAPSAAGFETNRFSIRGLYRAALVAALAPTLILLWGFLRGATRRGPPFFFFLTAAFSMAGFLAWLAVYNVDDGDALKATFLLQACPFLALLGGDLMAELGRRRKGLYRGACLSLGLAAVFAAPLSLTRYLPPAAEALRALYPESRAAEPIAPAPIARAVSAGAPAPASPAKALSDRGVAEYSAGDPAAAKRDLEAALALDPTLEDAYLSLVALSFSEGRMGEASRWLKTADARLRGDAADDFFLKTAEDRKRVQESLLAPRQ